MSLNLEHSLLAKRLKNALRSQRQINKINESDCEIIKLQSKRYLATTIDSFSDEWSVGLFKKPETLAHFCVHGCVSDLVVSGTKPLGFLFSPQWGFETSSEIKDRVFRVVLRELKKIGVPLLGGDEGYAREISLTGVALGESKHKPKTRLGIKPGDVLCTIGPLGLNPAFGFQYLLNHKAALINEINLCPVAYTNAIPGIAKFARAAIDTSDGLCSSLHIFSRLNEIKFEINADALKYHPLAIRFCRSHKIPRVCLWYGEFGDYQPMISVPKHHFLKLKKLIPSLYAIGRALPRSESRNMIKSKGNNIVFEPEKFLFEPRTQLAEIRTTFEHMLHYVKSGVLADV